MNLFFIVLTFLAALVPQTAYALDPTINFAPMLHDAFALEYKTQEELYPNHQERVASLNALDPSAKTALVYVTQGNRAKGDWANCTDFQKVSRSEYRKLRTANPNLDFPDFFWANNPVALTLYFETSRLFRLTEFEASIALENRHFEISDVIDPDTRFFSEQTISKLSAVKSRGYSFLLERPSRNAFGSRLKIDVIDVIKCTQGFEIIRIAGKMPIL